MVNRNGNNNGHNNGTGNGLVHINGSRHDAALDATHELLWDGLSPAVTGALGQPLDPALVSQRKGRAGRTYDYLEGHVVIDQANRIFGFGGWGYELAGDVTLRQIENVDTKTGEVKTTSFYSAPVRVTVPGAPPRTDIGFNAVAEDNVDGHETAIKGAVTDGMKRALRSFGVQFGNGFYGDQPAEEAAGRRTAARQTGGNGSGNSRPQRAPAQARAASGPDNAPALRKRLIEIAVGQGFDEAGVRTAVTAQDGQEHRRPGRLGAGPAGGGRRQEAPGDAAGAAAEGGLARPDTRDTGIERGRLFGGGPASHYRTRRQRAMTTTMQTTMHTPWGWTQDIEALAEGVWRVATPSHGGLKLSRERWASLPGCVRDAMLTPTFAEEDCEEVIVRTLLGLGGDRERELALKVAGYFDRYAPALPHLRAAAPGPHYHAVAYWGGYGTDPFGRFDTRIEAESFVGDAEMARTYGKLEAVECSRTLPLCRAEGGRP